MNTDPSSKHARDEIVERVENLVFPMLDSRNPIHLQWLSVNMDSNGAVRISLIWDNGDGDILNYPSIDSPCVSTKEMSHRKIIAAGAAE